MQIQTSSLFPNLFSKNPHSRTIIYWVVGNTIDLSTVENTCALKLLAIGI